jgi:hypothetical protein
MKIAIVLIVTFLLNLPFGWLRRKEKKFSFKWFLYIHLPIPFIIVMRIWLGINPWFIPLIIAVAVAGQAIGARWKFGPEVSTSSES